MDFLKYMHIERFGNAEVDSVEMGECYVFPKIDGTNASIWNSDSLQAGGRRRHLSIESDNAGFYNWVLNGDKNPNLVLFFAENPNLRLYGEWLVPHSLKTYREDTWRQFYVFDVFNDINEDFLSYKEYKVLLDKFDIEYLAPLAVIRNATYENLLNEVESNTYLIKDGEGVGEGVVIKNYDYRNKYGRVCWAKIITNTFKEKHKKEQPQVKEMKQMVEQDFVDKYLDKSLVDKTYAKIVTDMDGWSSKYIMRLLSTVYHDFVTEEIWNFIKKKKNPTINFKTLHFIAMAKIKELLPEVF